MNKKIIAVILVAAMCLPLCSCDDGNPYKTSGESSVNQTPPPGLKDGIYYETEDKLTENFIAYKENGRLMLYPMNEKKYTPYDPSGLCKVKAGNAYTITYDAQVIRGGLAGQDVRYFLTVYDCRECPYDKLFENGILTNPIRREFPIGGNLEGNLFIAFKGFWGGYDVYTPEKGKIHYQELREVRFTRTSGGNTVDMEFKAYCNRNISNDYIIDTLLSRKYDGKADFVYTGCYYINPDDSSSELSYDSIEKFATGSTFSRNSFRLQFDERPAEGRRLITYEEMASKDMKQLGLSKDLYQWVYTGWADRDKGWRSDYNSAGGPARKCDVLIFSGDIKFGTSIAYDKDFRLYLYESPPQTEESEPETFQYYVVFINTEFNDLLPQD